MLAGSVVSQEKVFMNTKGQAAEVLQQAAVAICKASAS
jgi:hypothetical protein